MKKISIRFSLVLLFLAGCVDPYSPKVTTEDFGYLVVDGLLNTGDTTRIVLSRTRPVNSGDDLILESAAVVSVQEENGSSYPFVLTGPGTYSLLPGQVDLTKNLRLHIETNDGKEYASAYVTPFVTPPIDSVSYKVDTINGVPSVQVYANTHDAPSNSPFYLWTYEETWEYSSKFASTLIRIGDSIASRTPEQNVNYCWSSMPSGKILIGSSTALSQNIVSEFPLTQIPLTSYKVSIRYSLLLHQYSVSRDAFEYWQTIQRNNESLGTIFGSLPVKITGNFTCLTDPTNPVFGFFSATSPQTKRMFIDNRKLPATETVDPFYDGCEVVDLNLVEASFATTELYLSAITAMNRVVGYHVSSAYCADCTYHGGNTKQPSFW